ncbi:peptide ABC transporter substrate-binding protein [Leptothoe spongobia]|uniref:Peptide ABC transporter substrate-binding protein n=1 Tax=Leptothoe spongobia TAU-MAC 1115 TaxID=1967444 RepID=A0A947DHN3_9CYAN|nr:peptide ABC transporter substrate-binding protein [Leptothoe spongobia]MBT9316514.1 peptide ABC transporter substrate-binding protein [Leptothoe spongobia TAU-MAC 1115]
MERSARWLIGSCLIGALVGLGACRPASDTPQTTGNDSVLKLLYWQAPTILNPHLSNGFKDSEASRITLEPLASFDAAGNLKPFLAAEIPSLENGGVASDGTSVTWTLRSDVLWSDGTPFTAEDVAFTYTLLSNPEVGSTTAGTYETIKSVEALDPTTVKITFIEPNPAWSLVFTGTTGMILPAHAFKDFNGANARSAPANLQPIGTGPYQVTTFKPGDVVVYEPNPHYRESVGFERVELKGGGDAASAARAVMQTGEADFAYNIQVEAPILKQMETGGKGQFVTSFGSLVERILFNFTDPNQTADSGERSSVEFPHPFFSDVKVRQAFSLAIDRDTIAEQLYGPAGQGTVNFLVSPESYRSGNTSYGFDLDQANQLLDQAGWVDSNGDGTRDRNGTEMQVLFITSVNPVRQKTQEIIKQNLAAIGVGTELRSLDPAVYFSGDPASEDTVEHFYADLQMFATGNTNPDPAAYLKTYTCDQVSQKDNNWSGQNYSRYCNPDYDALWQQSTTELDINKRTDLLIQMNDTLIEDYAVLPIVHRADIDAVSDRITGIDLTPWDLHTWNIAEWKRP